MARVQANDPNENDSQNWDNNLEPDQGTDVVPDQQQIYEEVYRQMDPVPTQRFDSGEDRNERIAQRISSYIHALKKNGRIRREDTDQELFNQILEDTGPSKYTSPIRGALNKYEEFIESEMAAVGLKEGSSSIVEYQDDRDTLYIREVEDVWENGWDVYD